MGPKPPLNNWISNGNTYVNNDNIPARQICFNSKKSHVITVFTVFRLLTDFVSLYHKKHLVWNQQFNQNQTLMEQSLDGPLSKLCPAIALSHQDGHHSAVALLLKAALIQVSDYRLLGASGLCNVLQIVVCPFVLFLLAIVLSVLSRFTDCDYPFGTFKLFLFRNFGNETSNYFDYYEIKD